MVEETNLALPALSQCSIPPPGLAALSSHRHAHASSDVSICKARSRFGFSVHIHSTSIISKSQTYPLFPTSCYSTVHVPSTCIGEAWQLSGTVWILKSVPAFPYARPFNYPQAFRGPVNCTRVRRVLAVPHTHPFPFVPIEPSIHSFKPLFFASLLLGTVPACLPSHIRSKQASAYFRTFHGSVPRTKGSISYGARLSYLLCISSWRFWRGRGRSLAPVSAHAYPAARSRFSVLHVENSNSTSHRMGLQAKDRNVQCAMFPLVVVHSRLVRREVVSVATSGNICTSPLLHLDTGISCYSSAGVVRQRKRKQASQYSLALAQHYLTSWEGEKAR